jgi:hypothetical protein
MVVREIATGRSALLASLLTLCLVAAGSGNASPMSYTPVRIGGIPDLDACLSTGRPRIKPAAGHFLAVRAMPSATGKIVAKLGPYHQFWLCDSTRSGEWTGIVFDPVFDPDRDGDGPADCGVGSPVAKEQGYAGACASGWVATRYVELLSG